MMLSDLPRDLAEEVLVRLPVTSMRAVRFVCKKWNTLTKEESFTKKHVARAKAAAAREVVVVMNDRVNLMSVNLRGIHNNVDPPINHLGKLVSLTDLDGVDMSEVFHCDGLLLCITRDRTRFVVWNPYCGQTRRYFKHNREDVMDKYAIGYETRESSGRSYKVLRFGERTPEYVCYELDYINSETRMEIIPRLITADWFIPCHQRGVSLKGNTYWYSQSKSNAGGRVFFLVCFDFTRERFGPHLSLPFLSYRRDTLSLSSVRDEQLAVLFQKEDTLYMEIWITTVIEPETVSWSKLFFAVDVLKISDSCGSFFVDEEKKVVVVFDEEYREMRERYIAAYIIGEDGIITKIDLGKAVSTSSYHPQMCSCVPSLAQIKMTTTVKLRN